jgi:hypothetical protein
MNKDNKPQIKKIVLKNSISNPKIKKYNLTIKKLNTIFGIKVKNIVTVVGEPS